MKTENNKSAAADEEDGYKPFPVDALPPPLDSYVREGAAALGCDSAMIVLPVIAVCGSLIGNTRTIRLKNSWRERSVFWTCVVAESGTQKSPAQDRALRPLQGLQNRLRADHAAKLAKAAERLANIEEATKRSAAPKSEPPPVPRVLCNDVTIERLGGLLSENLRGILCARDELSGWLGSFARYKSGSTDLPQWLEFYRAGHLTIDRKTGEVRSLFVDRAAVSVCGTIQPEIFAKTVRGDFLESGLVARLLLAMPPKQKKVWSEADIDPSTTAKFQQMVERLYALDFGTNKRGKRTPKALALDPDAKKAWIQFYDEWSAEQHGAKGERAAALAKLEGYAARFALLHHVVGRAAGSLDDAVPIREESVRAGALLARWFAAEAQRVYSLFHKTDDERDAEWLLDRIASHGGSVTPRDLQRTNGKRYRTADAAETALNALVQAGEGRWEAVTRDGGKPSRVFRLGKSGPSDSHPTDADGDANFSDILMPLSDCRTVGLSDCPSDGQAQGDGGSGYSPTYPPTDGDNDEDMGHDPDGAARRGRSNPSSTIRRPEA